MNYRSVIYASHILFGLAWVVMGYLGLKQKLSGDLYDGLKALAIAIIAFHGYKLLTGPEFRRMVYLFHVVVIAGILLYLGIKGRKSPSLIYYIMIVLGAIATLYHGYSLYNELASPAVEVI